MRFIFEECRLVGCSPPGSYKNRRFGGTYRLYHQREKSKFMSGGRD
jgi:hypothetical protein